MAQLHFLKSVTDTINTSFIFASGDTLLVIDGGFPSEAPYLHDYLLALGGHVTAWFITHFHHDHMGAFFTMLKEYPDITVDKVYYHFPSDEFLLTYEPKQDEWMTADLIRLVREATQDRKIPVVTVQRGDVYTFDKGRLRVSVLRTPDERITHNPTNNSSCVFRFEANDRRILFLGDLGTEGGQQLMDFCSPAELKSDYVQMSHHGQGGVSKACYEIIRPTYCLWPTPSWLWDNMGPGGYDTGIFGTVVTRGWMSALGCVKRHYLMIHGTQVIDLSKDSV